VKNRSIVLFVIGTLEILIGLISVWLVYGYWAAGQGGIPNSMGPLYFWSFAALSLLILLGAGIILRNDAARRLSIFAMLLILIISIYKTLFAFYPELLWITLFCISFSGAVLFYLTRPVVKGDFY